MKWYGVEVDVAVDGAVDCSVDAAADVDGEAEEDVDMEDDVEDDMDVDVDVDVTSSVQVISSMSEGFDLPIGLEGGYWHLRRDFSQAPQGTAPSHRTLRLRHGSQAGPLTRRGRGDSSSFSAAWCAVSCLMAKISWS